MARARTVATVDAGYASRGGVWGWRTRGFRVETATRRRCVVDLCMYIARIVMDDDDDDRRRRRECRDVAVRARASGAGLDFARARLR